MAYGDDAGFEAWLVAMGYTLPSGAPSSAVLRMRGSTWLDATYEPLWTGMRTDPLVQDDAWPRTGALLNCSYAIPDDLIPNAVVIASYRAGMLFASEATPAASVGARVKREKVDVIEAEYFDDGALVAGAASGFVDPTIDGMMRQFICDTGGIGFMFESIGGSCCGD